MDTSDILRFAICDDRLQDRERLVRLVQEYVHAEGILADVDAFESGEALLLAMAERSYAIVFLDIFMDGMTGVQAAERIRAAGGAECALVFVTTSREHALEGFALNAVHYLTKPVSYEDIAECFRRCSAAMRAYVRRIEILSNRETISLREADIRYIEVYGNRCIVHAAGAGGGSVELSTYTPLGALYEKLDPEQFVYPHRSFVVNLAYIVEIPGAELKLKNGVVVSISRSERENIKRRYIEHLLQSTRGEGGMRL